MTLLANGVSIYEPEHADVFEADGNLDYYLDDSASRAAVCKSKFVLQFVSAREPRDDFAALGARLR